MPNITSVVNFFPKVSENTVPMTLGGSITSGATTVPVNGMSNYSNGDIVVFTVDAPTPTLKQVFTGTVSGSNVVNVVWTYGTNQAHTTGAPVIDYVSATTLDMITAGITKQHTQAGAHTGLTTDTLSASGAVSFGSTLGVTGVTTLASLILNGGLTGSGIANSITSYSNAGSAGGTFYYFNIGGLKVVVGQTGAFTGSGTTTVTKNVNMPTSFFTTILGAFPVPVPPYTNTNAVYANVNSESTSVIGISLLVQAGGSPSNPLGLLVIGT